MNGGIPQVQFADRDNMTGLTTAADPDQTMSPVSRIFESSYGATNRR